MSLCSPGWPQTHTDLPALPQESWGLRCAAPQPTLEQGVSPSSYCPCGWQSSLTCKYFGILCYRWLKTYFTCKQVTGFVFSKSFDCVLQPSGRKQASQLVAQPGLCRHLVAPTETAGRRSPLHFILGWKMSPAKGATVRLSKPSSLESFLFPLIVSISFLVQSFNYFGLFTLYFSMVGSKIQ